MRYFKEVIIALKTRKYLLKWNVEYCDFLIFQFRYTFYLFFSLVVERWIMDNKQYFMGYKQRHGTTYREGYTLNILCY